MKHFFIAGAFTFFSLCVWAQPASKAMPLYKKAQQLEQKGLFADAIGAYKKSIAIDKKFDSSHLALAALFLRISKNDSAIAVLKKAVKAKPDFAGAYAMLGLIYRDYTKNSTEAIVHYSNAVKYDSANKQSFYSLAWCSNDLKQYSNGINYAIKALDIDNSYKPAYNELAHAIRNLGIFKEGIEIFRQRINISVNELPLYYSGLCYIQLKDKAGAQKIYEELLAIKSKSAESLKPKIDAMQ